MEQVLMTWQAHEYEHRPKDRTWYWVVGIVAVSVAIASFVLQNYLFGVIALLGGFTVMVVGTAKPPRHTYAFTDGGFMVNKELIPYNKITRFAVSEENPHLTLETMTLIGVIKAPLTRVDPRAIRMELKNRNIKEEEKLDQLVDRVAKTLGL